MSTLKRWKRPGSGVQPIRAATSVRVAALPIQRVLHDGAAPDRRPTSALTGQSGRATGLLMSAQSGHPCDVTAKGVEE